MEPRQSEDRASAQRLAALKADRDGMEEAYSTQKEATMAAEAALAAAMEEQLRWRQRVSELRALQTQQAAAITADSERRRLEAQDSVEQRSQLEALSAEVQSLRDELSQVEKGAKTAVREAVACVEQGFSARLVQKAQEQQSQYEELRLRRKAEEAYGLRLRRSCAERQAEVGRLRRRCALARLGRAAKAHLRGRDCALEEALCSLERLRRRFSREQGELDEEVALRAVALKKELQAEEDILEAAREERDRELDRLTDEVNAMKERTAKAKELLRQHARLQEVAGPGAKESQRIRRLAEASAASAAFDAADRRARQERIFEAAHGPHAGDRPFLRPRLEGRMRCIDEHIARAKGEGLQRSQSEDRLGGRYLMQRTAGANSR
ncbi:unnamed protein product [Symbiodinium natans]|uniref:Uncharacterized protein n=1 Tax=Symbiodinium natans TaxID=878477 RepID=A0A812TGH8_9DINO|nr:unnamed protein product [Symbiodinium natans]